MYSTGGRKRLVSRKRVCVLGKLESGLMKSGKIRLCEDIVKELLIMRRVENCLLGERLIQKVEGAAIS